MIAERRLLLSDQFWADDFRVRRDIHIQVGGGKEQKPMPTYRVVHINGLREKNIVARDEDQARELWGGDLRLKGAADRLNLTVDAYRETILVEKIKP